MILTPTQSLQPHLYLLFKDYIFYVFICIPSGYMHHMSAGSQGGQKRVSDALELNLIVNLTDVLPRTKQAFSAKAASTLNC